MAYFVFKWSKTTPWRDFSFNAYVIHETESGSNFGQVLACGRGYYKYDTDAWRLLIALTLEKTITNNVKKLHRYTSEDTGYIHSYLHRLYQIDSDWSIMTLFVI